VEAAIGETLVMHDATDATDGSQARQETGWNTEAPGSCLIEKDNGDVPVACNHVFGHLPIARLKDMQRQERMRKEHRPRERKQRQSLERELEPFRN